MRYLNESDIDKIAIGAAVLGTGGGGDPYIGKLVAKEAIRKYGKVKLISLDELDDSSLVIPLSSMGAPTVSIEKIPSEIEFTAPLEKLEEVIHKKVDVIMPIEIGGINSLYPVIASAKKGIPILDADTMGRAFPEAQMVTFYLEGYKSSPITMGDEKGNSIIVYPTNTFEAERICRSITVEMGGSSSICDYNLSGKEVKKAAIKGTLTLAENIGEILLNSKGNGASAISKILKLLNGYKLFDGKITNISRNLDGGFTRGKAIFNGIKDNSGEQYTIYFQNEHLIAKHDDKLLCCTPDLISVLDFETGMPITTERIRYGERVTVVAFPCNEKWRTEKGLKTVGPKYFGYNDIEYKAVEELQGGK
jgi:uncharacterized protein